jgi:hypothetical protein
VWCGVVWCGADWNLRQLDARLLYAPAKLGAGCSLMALAGLAAVLAWSEIVRAYGGLPNAHGGLPAADKVSSLRRHQRICGRQYQTVGSTQPIALYDPRWGMLSELRKTYVPFSTMRHVGRQSLPRLVSMVKAAMIRTPASGSNVTSMLPSLSITLLRRAEVNWKVGEMQAFSRLP